jgi:transcription elongation factor GreA
MSTDHDAAALLRAVGLLPDGPVRWGRPVRYGGPGVFVVELPAPVANAPLDLAKVGKWLEHVPDLRMHGERPVSKALMARLAQFWLPRHTVLFVGSTPGSVGGRVAAVEKTVPGDRRPAASGHWLHLLRTTPDMLVWWAATDAPEEYEDALLETFALTVGEDRDALPDTEIVLPWANLRTPAGARKATGITNAVLPDVREPGPPPVTRVVDLPPGEADGARDEARRGRRPAPGRGAGRIASVAAYAAQGSPRRAQEPIYLSQEGLDRVHEELADLVQVRRPEIIRRIATAREHGDLKENAEYQTARQEQSFIEGKIRALEARLKSAVIVAPTQRGAVVELGSRVRVEVEGEEHEMTIVGSTEAAPGRVSNVSPVGAALIGRRVGDAVTIRTPSGEIRYAVLAIE